MKMVITRVLLLVLFAFAIINRFRAVSENRNNRAYEKEFRYYVMVSVAITAALSSLVYAIQPSWFGFAQLQFPGYLNLAGNILVVFAILFWGWAKRSLGENWSSRIAIRPDHTLTRSGPYRWVRHPVYTAYLILMVGIALSTGNAAITSIYAFGAFLTATRIPREEKVLREALGTAYIEYKSKTGRFFPRLFSTKNKHR